MTARCVARNVAFLTLRQHCAVWWQPMRLSVTLNPVSTDTDVSGLEYVAGDSARRGRWLSMMYPRLSAEISARLVDGRAPHVRKATRPEGQHLAICQALGLETQPGGIEKRVY